MTAHTVIVIHRAADIERLASRCLRAFKPFENRWRYDIFRIVYTTFTTSFKKANK